MKELTIEEKAKRYDDALKRARKLQHDNAWVTSIFPELKESEDERIRKVLIGWINLEPSTSFNDTFDGFSKEQILAWFEKQGNIDLEFFENGENEKREFVGYGFLKCKGDFLSFKEGENYWLEYMGKDNYNVRSDNLLGQTFHITPQQLYTVFRPTTWLEKQGDKDKLIQELGEYKVKYTQEVLEKCMNKKDDERLRKTTIDFLKEFADKGYENAVECIDWIEKQGETSHQLEENRATAKGLDDELEAFLCKYEEVSGEEKARLIGVAEHFYLIGKNPNANL